MGRYTNDLLRPRFHLRGFYDVKREESNDAQHEHGGEVTMLGSDRATVNAKRAGPLSPALLLRLRSLLLLNEAL